MANSECRVCFYKNECVNVGVFADGDCLAYANRRFMKVNMLTKEVLTKLYIGQDLTMRQVATELSVSSSTIAKQLKKFGMTVHKQGRKKAV